MLLTAGYKERKGSICHLLDSFSAQVLIVLNWITVALPLVALPLSVCCVDTKVLSCDA